MQERVRGAVRMSMLAGRDPAAIVGASAADTMYAIDRVADGRLLEWVDAEWPRADAIEVVTEALDEPVVIGRGDAVWTCILDPIDGTRGLMYDKRAAWSLGALAPRGGTLQAVVAAAMTELPTTKQDRCDTFSTVRGSGVVSERADLSTGARWPVTTRPSRATDLRHGWASFARFFPAGKALLAAFEETLWEELYGGAALADLQIFDDQYLATAGQFAELLSGHDRMLGDLRPLAHRRIGARAGLASHPYDCCTALVLEEAGCVITDPWGEPLDCPLDTTTPVAWVGFANRELASRVRPALDAALAMHFGGR